MFSALVFLALCFLVVWVVQTLQRYRKRQRDAEIHRLCPQYGLRYLDQIPVADLGKLREPPWTMFHDGLASSLAMQTLVAECHGGRIFSAVFVGGLYGSRASNKRRTELCTIVGMIVPDLPRHVALFDYFLQLRLANGLGFAVQGDHVYAMFVPSTRRMLRMDPMEQMQCMLGMRYALEGNFSRATRLFGELPGTSMVWVGLVLLFLCALFGLALWLCFIVQWMALVPIGILVGSWLCVALPDRSDLAPLRSYLGK